LIAQNHKYRRENLQHAFEQAEIFEGRARDFLFVGGVKAIIQVLCANHFRNFALVP
jgi:hypothetical protein